VTVSLICTVFNEEGSIGNLLASISRQSRRPDEFVVCDAGSTDGTLAVLYDWHRESGIPLEVLVRPGVNIATGRNVAIATARYELIAVTDAGCVLDDQWLERICAHLDGGHTHDVAYGRSVAVGTSAIGRVYADLHDAKTHGTRLTNTEHSSRSVAFTKSAWDDVGGYPEGLTLAGEDTAFFAALEEAHSAVVARDATVEWFHGADTLGTIYRLHRRNSIGEGEARLWPARFGLLAAAYAVSTVVMTWPSTRPRWRLLAAAMLVAFTCRYLVQVVRTRGAGARTGLLPLVSVTRDLGMLRGYVAGLRGSGQAGGDALHTAPAPVADAERRG
jgi:glycosyltransferase involved in cell wall biosynthesis